MTGIEHERGARSSGPPESPDSALVAGHLPMWAFDRRTLRFVAANDQALRRVGYSRGDFLSARLTDILPGASPGGGGLAHGHAAGGGDSVP